MVNFATTGDVRVARTSPNHHSSSHSVALSDYGPQGTTSRSDTLYRVNVVRTRVLCPSFHGGNDKWLLLSLVR